MGTCRRLMTELKARVGPSQWTLACRCTFICIRNYVGFSARQIICEEASTSPRLCEEEAIFSFALVHVQICDSPGPHREWSHGIRQMLYRIENVGQPELEFIAAMFCCL